MLRDYLRAALERAHYELIDDAEPFYGEVPGLKGVWATGETLEACRDWVEYVVVDTGFSLESDEEISSDLFAPRRNAATLAALRVADRIVAVGLAALGTLRDNPVLTVIAMMALVVFTTFQSFAVFAAIIQGAWLFVVLGLVFLATGFLFDRARRGITATLEGTES